MSNKNLSLLFTGQGSQFSQMGSDFIEKYDWVKERYNLSSNLLGYDIIKAQHDPKLLNLTQYSQPMIFVFSSIIIDLCKNYIHENFSNITLAGHSLGEYCALYFAESLDFAEMLEVVKCRGDSMATVSNPDKYVMYNYEQNVWSIGSMTRTNWRDSFGVREVPFATDKEGRLYNHETGTDDAGSAMAAFIESSPVELSVPNAPDGTNLFMIDRLVPDATITGTMKVELKSKKHPLGSEVTKGPFTISPSTSKVSCRAKGRQIQVKLSNTDVGDTWALGRFRINLRADGLR